MKSANKKSTLSRMSRIEGQVRGVARMIDEDRYCIDVLTQLRAIQAALGKVEQEILNDHVEHCVEHAIMSGDKDEQRRKVAELIEVLDRSKR